MTMMPPPTRGGRTRGFKRPEKFAVKQARDGRARSPDVLKKCCRPADPREPAAQLASDFAQTHTRARANARPLPAAATMPGVKANTQDKTREKEKVGGGAFCRVPPARPLLRAPPPSLLALFFFFSLPRVFPSPRRVPHPPAARPLALSPPCASVRNPQAALRARRRARARALRRWCAPCARPRCLRRRR